MTFVCESLEFLGHSLSSSDILPLLSKVKEIQELPESQTKLQLQSFLGLGIFVGQKGDRVFYCYGAGQPFKGLGVIVHLVGRNAYEVLTDRGYLRIYNKSNLKVRSIMLCQIWMLNGRHTRQWRQMETQLIGEKGKFVPQTGMRKI